MSSFYDLTAGSEGSDNDDDDDILQAAINASLLDMNNQNSRTDASSAVQSEGGSSSGSNFSGNSRQNKRPLDAQRHAALESPQEVSISKQRKRPRSVESGEATNSDSVEKAPPLFRLISTPSDGPGSGSVGLKDLLSGGFTEALLTNYMVDMALLLEAQPRLEYVPVIVVHGFKPNTSEGNDLRTQCNRISQGIKPYHPELPQFGTHHAKMMVLKFPRGVRVVVLTANFVDQDVTGKSQGVWYQEFPLRQSPTCDFESTLVDYLEKLGGPVTAFARSLRQYDFTSARVALVPSVPGTRPKHKGADLYKYGHMRVRGLLETEPRLLKDEHHHKVAFQFSSLASLTKDPNQWLMELLTSFMAQKDGEQQDWKKPEGGAGSTSTATATRNVLKERLRLVWPTIEAIRNSSKGWAAGGSIPCRTNDMFGGDFIRADMRRFEANDPRPELRPLLRKWQGNPAVHRTFNAPHIKSYVRYRETCKAGGEPRVDGDEVAWFLLSSSNLSRSAWGFLDKTSKQLLVRSFEMGIMFLPSLLGKEDDRQSGSSGGTGTGTHDAAAFTCTPGEMGLIQRLPLSYRIPPGKAVPLPLLPIPYLLPAPRYNFDAGDKPWVWDQNYAIPDKFGKMWTGGKN